MKSKLKQREYSQSPSESLRSTAALRKAAEYAATPRRIILGNRNVTKNTGSQIQGTRKYSATPASLCMSKTKEAQILAFDVRAALLKSAGSPVSVCDLASTPIPLGFIEEGITSADHTPMNPSDISSSVWRNSAP